MSSVLCVILNWRTAEMSLKAAQAAMVAMEGIDGAITLVDNDSQDGSFEAMVAASRDWPRVRVLQSGRNGGYGAGNNCGIRAGLPDGSRPDYVYILNSDAFPAPDAIRALVAYLDSHPDAGFAGSHIHGEDGAPHTTAFRFPSIASEFEGAAKTGPVSRLLKNAIVAPPLPTVTTRVDWLAGASVLMRQSVLDQIGVFDETFFLYFEETDLCLRAARAGWPTVYVVESRVMHLGSVSTGMKDWRRVPAYWFASRRHYFQKNHGRIYALTATLAHVAGLGLYGLRVLVQRKKPHTPPHFLRDLVKHEWGTRRPQES
ncbi:MAG: glycosyltransferase family 2 protein [Rhodobacter sp.]|nr:glycosyltransferase family 2 protein [Paracoccaceae bacterium]MCC0081140.1 glycosyltransferase family 2 protein [Rhodobacter sp.]